jgi:hypothetical protein
MSRLFALPLLFLAAAAAQDRKPAAKVPAPKLTVAVPLTVAAGQKVKLTVYGLNLDGVTEVRMHEPKSRAKLAGTPRKTTLPQNAPVERIGDWSVEVELDLAKELPAGTISFSVVGPNGESNAVKLAVADDTPRVKEKEPNEGFATAQPIAAPCVVEGAIGRERDVDVFKISGKAGEKLRLDVQAARLGSPLDALLTVHDAAGRVIASEDDTNGSADPILTMTLPRDGDYYVSLIDANDLGGPAFAYRLVVTK